MQISLIAGNSLRRQSAAKPNWEGSTTIRNGVGYKCTRNGKHLIEMKI